MNVKIEIIVNGESVSCSNPVILSESDDFRASDTVNECYSVFGLPINSIILGILANIGVNIRRKELNLKTQSGANINLYQMVFSYEYEGVRVSDVIRGVVPGIQYRFDDIAEAKMFYGIK